MKELGKTRIKSQLTYINIDLETDGGFNEEFFLNPTLD
jgi:hypothetical protein